MEVVRALADKGVLVDPALVDRFDMGMVEDYWKFLVAENQRGGFFSAADEARILERHVFESLVLTDYVAHRLPVSRETIVADVGSGPGLPGFLFACRKEPPYVVLVDSSKRRLGLLQEWIGRRAGDGTRVEFRYERAEEIVSSWDIVVMRAFVRFPFCVEMVANGVRPRGFAVYFGSGRDHFSDREEKYLKRVGFVPRETERPRELDFLGDRRISYFEKINKPDPGYPRKWSRIQSEMEQWER